jgi:HK97 family phage major capsid protein
MDHKTRRELAFKREERASRLAEMRKITGLAEEQRRELTHDESKRWDRLEREIEDLTAEIKALDVEPSRITRDVVNPDSGLATDRDAGPILGREERLFDWQAAHARRGDEELLEQAHEFSLGSIVQAMVTGERGHLSDVERRVLAEGTDSAGGFLTPELLAAQVIDLVRKKGRVFQAGASIVPVESDKQSIPRIATGVTAAWRAENAAIAESDQVFERVTFTPRSLAVIVRLSEELFADMVPGGGAAIENDIVKALALELDRVVLRGSGTAPEPRGIVNQTGVNLVAFGGANGDTPDDYGFLVDGVAAIRDDNGQPNAILYSSRTQTQIDKLEDSTGQPLRAPRSISELPQLVTNQIPNNLTVGTSTDCTEVYVGDWPEALVGMRSSIQLRVLTERYADVGQIALRAMLRADVQLAHPALFAVVQGVRA